MSEDASYKKFLVSNFNKHRMADNLPTMDKFHELQHMFTNMKVYDISVEEIYILSSTIDKLPNSLRDVKHALKRA